MRCGELSNGLGYVIRYGIAWRATPNDLPPWFAFYQQAQRWLEAGAFRSCVERLRGGAILSTDAKRSTPCRSGIGQG